MPKISDFRVFEREFTYLLPFSRRNSVAVWQYCHNHLVRGERDDSFLKWYRVKSPIYRNDWNIFPFLVKISIWQLIRGRLSGHGYIYPLNKFYKTPSSGEIVPRTTNIWGWSRHMSNRICNNWTFAPSFRAKRFNMMWYFDKAMINYYWGSEIRMQSLISYRGKSGWMFWKRQTSMFGQIHPTHLDYSLHYLHFRLIYGFWHTFLSIPTEINL